MKNIFVKATKVTENLDGSATIEFEYGSDFKQAVRERYNRKKCTKKLVAKFIHQAIWNIAALHEKENK